VTDDEMKSWEFWEQQMWRDSPVYDELVHELGDPYE